MLVYFVHFKDEKEKYDPYGFRDFILGGLNVAGTDLEAIWKFLDQAGSKVDYRRYGEVLFDILIAGGLLGKIYSSTYTFCVGISVICVDIMILLFSSWRIYISGWIYVSGWRQTLENKRMRF